MELTAATAGATRATGGFLGTSRRRPQSSRGDSAPGLRFWFAIGGVVDSRRVSSENRETLYLMNIYKYMRAPAGVRLLPSREMLNEKIRQIQVYASRKWRRFDFQSAPIDEKEASHREVSNLLGTPPANRSMYSKQRIYHRIIHRNITERDKSDFFPKFGSCDPTLR
uniref:Uncharacterized protein n=2 Tax=Oryza sativa subsp. japonica TaxID=39947 RepID=Q53NR6_ORYSJ|nr:hypothetical protein LOC_Os11g07900 [Oryza sativa Japonica Group]AAX96306.1 hypothetical protein [Oryza sativa Japonica Group]ABA91794.1 hypothetical protein LOC_Os11g07900 [Oryza sativa Japonica Group]